VCWRRIGASKSTEKQWRNVPKYTARPGIYEQLICHLLYWFYTFNWVLYKSSISVVETQSCCRFSVWQRLGTHMRDEMRSHFYQHVYKLQNIYTSIELHRVLKRLMFALSLFEIIDIRLFFFLFFGWGVGCKLPYHPPSQYQRLYLWEQFIHTLFVSCKQRWANLGRLPIFELMIKNWRITLIYCSLLTRNYNYFLFLMSRCVINST